MRIQFKIEVNCPEKDYEKKIKLYDPFLIDRIDMSAGFVALLRCRLLSQLLESNT